MRGGFQYQTQLVQDGWMGMPREMEDIEKRKGRAMGRDAGPTHSDIAQGSTVNSSHLELFRTGSPHAVICPQHCHQRLLIRGKLEMHQENGNFSLQVSIQLQNSKIFCADRVLKLHSIFFSTNRMLKVCIINQGNIGFSLHLRKYQYLFAY